jgi:N-acetylglutamate synthase-like GNAT family acetyltransferase
MSTPTRIRQATTDDIPILVDLIRTAFAEVAQALKLNEKEHPRCTSFYSEQRMHQDFAKGIRFFILEQFSKAIGCVAMEVNTHGICYLMRLAILPPYRKKNLGKKLVQHVFHQCRQAGIRQVHIAIVDSADSLKKWYQSMGFVQFETQTVEHLPFTVAFLSIAI